MKKQSGEEGNRFICKKGFEVKALCSNLNYIGTLDEEGMPNCRLSVYYKTAKEADDALQSGRFTHRHCMENDFCSGESGCELRRK